MNRLLEELKQYPSLSRLVLIAAAFFFTFDIFADISMDDASLLHIIAEIAMIVLIIIVFVQQAQLKNRMLRELVQQQNQSQHNPIYDYMTSQFDALELTASERDVASMLIKGFGFDEIATVRGVAVKTIRHQASAIYAKSETTNRAEFTGKFLDYVHKHRPLKDDDQSTQRSNRN